MNLVFNIATVERRKASFLKVLQALASQELKGNHINIACSYGYDREIRRFVDDHFESNKITNGKFTCEKKFFAFDQTEFDSYFLTLDDDIIYPVDYTKRLIDAIERFHRKAVVGFHGSRFVKFPVTDFRRQRILHQYFNFVHSDQIVHILGTGACGFHISTLRQKGFGCGVLEQSSNMTDDVFSAFCRKHEIELICAKHKAQWMRIMPGTQDDACTWKQDMIKGYDKHLKLLNECN